MNIFLTGYRCTGKTTIGKQLAGLFGFDFIDADEMLVEDAGMTVAEIVERFGWDDFRDRESEVLKKLCSMNNVVVATGGGVILRDHNVDCMKKAGTVVWLKASVETIAERMVRDDKTGEQRPGLTDKGAVREIEETLTLRLPMYQGAMNFSVDTDDKSVDEICSKIKNTLEQESVIPPKA